MNWKTISAVGQMLGAIGVIISIRFGAHLGRFLRFADSVYFNVLDGTLDKHRGGVYERTIAEMVAYPGFQTWWATRKHWHMDEFCALIDRHIQTAKPTIYHGYI